MIQKVSGNSLSHQMDWDRSRFLPMIEPVVSEESFPCREDLLAVLEVPLTWAPIKLTIAENIPRADELIRKLEGIYFTIDAISGPYFLPLSVS